MSAALHEIADEAYYRNTMLVSAANNGPGPSTRRVRVGVLGGRRPGAARSVAYNPDPPVEFGARGIDVEVPWPGGGTTETSGNSSPRPTLQVSPRGSSRSTRR